MNKAEAYLCAVIATATYSNRCDDNDFCMTAKFSNKDTDTQGFLGVAYDNTYVVAFRGSEETGLADWITDVKFTPASFPYVKGVGPEVKVHQGFIEAYQSVRDVVMEGVKGTPHQRVICTGHSLGGALATLCALDIQSNVSAKTVYCYTYGSPKVGNAQFAAAYNKQVSHTFRFVNASDMVPSLPPGLYEHIGQFHHLGQSDDADAGWLGEIVDNLVGTIENHLPYNYIQALRDLL